MPKKGTGRQCAALLYPALEPGRRYSRSEILSMGVLSADELASARRPLVAAGVLHYEPTRISTKPAYVLTGERPAPLESE